MNPVCLLGWSRSEQNCSKVIFKRDGLYSRRRGNSNMDCAQRLEALGFDWLPLITRSERMYARVSRAEPETSGYLTGSTDGECLCFIRKALGPFLSPSDRSSQISRRAPARLTRTLEHWSRGRLSEHSVVRRCYSPDRRTESVSVS